MSETAPVQPRERRPGRPKRPPLNDTLIAEAALEIIDEHGWSACTMNALAGRLGVRAPSLYHHIEGQDALIDLVRQLVVKEIHDPAIIDMPWDEAMYAFGVRYYRAFARHPNTIQVLSTTPVTDKVTLNMYECFLQTMCRSGLDGLWALEALLGLEHLALGFAYEWNAKDLMLDPEQAAAQGASLLAEIIHDRTEQSVVAEESFLSLLRRFIEMNRLTLDEPQTSLAES